ncbi:MAG: hypothetical protein AAFR61_26285, partial [Bacteroidota bacterium]
MTTETEVKDSSNTIIDHTLKRTISIVGRITLYLTGLTALVGGYYLLEEKFGFGNIEAGLLAIIPLFLVLLTDTLPSWLKSRKTKKLRENAIDDTIPPPGYFRLTPYETRDIRTFKRSDGAHVAILDWLLENENSILYLSGESGTGKSSLLNGYVIPKLYETKKPYQVLTIRGYRDPIKALKNSLLSSQLIPDSGTNEDLPVRKLLELAMVQQSSPNGRLLFVFDQFEEFLILHDEKKREEFEELVRSLEKNPIRGLSLLLVFRSDYTAQLLKCDLSELRPDKNWRIVGSFGRRDSENFFKNSGLKLGDKILQKILNEAESLESKEGLIRP